VGESIADKAPLSGGLDPSPHGLPFRVVFVGCWLLLLIYARLEAYNISGSKVAFLF